jgi:hypothetical protein
MRTKFLVTVTGFILLSSMVVAQKFAPQVAYETGALAPNGVAVGDLNGDGKIDVVVTNSDLTGTVAVLLGNGDGTLQPAVTYEAGEYPMFVALADFNKDGHPDIAVANRALGAPGTITILLGNGDGTFQPAVSYGSFVDAFSFAIGDLNHDGALDIAVADTSSGTLLLGHGDGTFSVGNSIGATNVLAFAIADFTHDHILDLAAANNGGSQIEFLAGNGHGVFTLISTYPVSTPPIALVTKDFNGDGFPDLAVADEAVNNLDSNVTVFESSGTSFVVKRYPYGHEPRSIVAADMNHDGKLDVITANEFNGTVDIFLNSKVGGFLPPTVLQDGNLTAGQDGSVAVADLNGDGKPDIIVTDGLNYVHVLLQK